MVSSSGGNYGKASPALDSWPPRGPISPSGHTQVHKYKMLGQGKVKIDAKLKNSWKASTTVATVTQRATTDEPQLVIGWVSTVSLWIPLP